MKKIFLTYWKYLAIPIGAMAGYAYYYYIGCMNGRCLIQSNPYLSTLYGAMLGGIFVFPSKKKKPKSEQEQNENK